MGIIYYDLVYAEPAVNAAVSSLYPAASENKSQSPSIPSSHSADHADVTSSVGDSGGSAEYETVSLIEDIGIYNIVFTRPLIWSDDCSLVLQQVYLTV